MESVARKASTGGDTFDPRTRKHHLLLFFPSRLDLEVPALIGGKVAPVERIVAHVVDLTTGEYLPGAWVWGKAMVPQLKGAIPDGAILGRLAQGKSKTGSNPPWILQPHTERDVRLAEKWLSENPRP